MPKRKIALQPRTEHKKIKVITEKGLTLVGTPFPTSSLTHGTRFLFRYDKKKGGLVLEHMGTKESIHKATDDSEKKKRKLGRERLDFRASILGREISRIVVSGIKTLQGRN